MKKIIYLIVFLGAFGALLAQQQQHNTAVDESGQFQTKVIIPFRIWDATPNSTPATHDVIKGQTRTFNPAEFIKLFEMQKEPYESVRLTLTLPTTVNGVTIAANWHFFDTPPNGNYFFPLPQGPFDWYDQQSSGWIAIEITSISAVSALDAGTRTFTAEVSGVYTSI